MKNLTRKLLTVLMAVALVFTSVNTVSAAPEKGQISVTGCAEGDTVTFYQIAEITHDANDAPKLMSQWTYMDGVTEAKLKALIDSTSTEEQINEWATGVASKALKTYTDVAEKENGDVIAKASVEPGVYLAIVTAKGNAQDKKIYNPVLLSLTYEDGQLEPAAIDFGSQYQEDGVLKSSEPKTDKEIAAGDTPDPTKPANNEGKKDEFDEDAKWEEGHKNTEGAKTASAGDVVTYRVKIDYPQYPAGAINKTMWASDTLPTGVIMHDELANDGDLKVLTIDDQPVVELTDANMPADLGLWGAYDATDNPEGLKVGDKVVFKNGKIIAKVALSDSGWSMVFDYDALGVQPGVPNQHSIVKYTATVTTDATMGRSGNKNKVIYEYSNNPNQGNTHKDEDEGPKENKYTWEDEEIIYTYEVAILKVDDKTLNPLSGAKFDVYYSATKLTKAEVVAEIAKENNGSLTKVGDQLESKADGIVGLTHVEYGFYYFVETKAPNNGYSLPANADGRVTEVEASWLACVSKTTTTGTIEWTSDAEEAIKFANVAKQDGWFDEESNHLTQAQYDALTADEKAKCVPAYLKSVAESAETIMENANDKTEGANPVGLNAEVVPNSKEPSLPSTGGVGTYIFTIAGVAILATAAFMLIFRKREDA